MREARAAAAAASRDRETNAAVAAERGAESDRLTASLAVAEREALAQRDAADAARAREVCASTFCYAHGILSESLGPTRQC